MPGVARNFDKGDTSKPKLWKAKICPFAAKPFLSFEELGVDYDFVEVDLGNKPASLFEINPKGQVPALLDRGQCICDSYILVQYIDEMWGDVNTKSLFPADPAKRALIRKWADYIKTDVINCFYGALLKKTTEEQEEEKTKLLNGLKTLNDAIKTNSDGPFFMGDKFTVFEIMLAPHVERLPALEAHRGLVIPETSDFERLRTWWKAVQEYPTYKKVKVTEEEIITAYARYSELKK